MSVKGVAATAYADVFLRVGIVFLAMVLYPEAQRRAQAEIDAVVGNNRLPMLEDRCSMPFLEATLREALHWHPVAPLSEVMRGPPAREANSFMVTIYPKVHLSVLGSIMSSNSSLRAVSYDDVRCSDPDPSNLKPEGFLNSDGTLNNDAIGYAFGICPGRHFANAVPLACHRHLC
ncbi:cytochrome P450 [Melanogaster broomeanus]|nr:cytochrome P450 [Melanogaster broomeanus]